MKFHWTIKVVASVTLFFFSHSSIIAQADSVLIGESFKKPAENLSVRFLANHFSPSELQSGLENGRLPEQVNSEKAEPVISLRSELRSRESTFKKAAIIVALGVLVSSGVIIVNNFPGAMRQKTATKVQQRPESKQDFQAKAKSSDWFDFKFDADFQATIYNVRLIIDWIKKQGYPHPEILDEYAAALDQAQAMPEEIYQATIFGKKTSSKNPGHPVIALNVRLLHVLLKHVTSIQSKDFLMEAVGFAIIREAHGFHMLRVSKSEYEEFYKMADRVLIKEMDRMLGKNYAWPSAAYSGYLKTHSNDLERLLTIQIAGEFYEAKSFIEAADWAKAKGIYSATKVDELLRADLEWMRPLVEARKKAQSLIQAASDEEVLAIELKILTEMLLPLFMENNPIAPTLSMRTYGHFAFLQIEEFGESGGKSGLNPNRVLKGTADVQDYLLPARAILENVNSLSKKWADRRSEMRNVSASQALGAQLEQQDRFVNEDIYLQKIPNGQGRLMAVMDGTVGFKSADRIQKYVASYFEEALKKNSGDVKLTLGALISNLHILVKSLEEGSTVSVVYIPDESKVAYVAVLGDSPVLIQKKGGELWKSPEHNIRTNSAERDAAVLRGAQIVKIKKGDHLPSDYLIDPEIVRPDGQSGLSYSGLVVQMSRMLGAKSLRRVLSHEPEIFEIELDENSFVLLGTDGVYGIGRNEITPGDQVLANFIREGKTAEEIVRFAIKRDGKNSDNTTAVLWRAPRSELRKAISPRLFFATMLAGLVSVSCSTVNRSNFGRRVDLQPPQLSPTAKLLGQLSDSKMKEEQLIQTIRQLGELEDRSVFDAISVYMDHDSIDVREAVFDALVPSDDPYVLKTLFQIIHGLGDQEAHWKRIVDSIKKMDSFKLVSELKDQLEANPSKQVVQALGESGAKEAIPVLFQILNDHQHKKFGIEYASFAEDALLKLDQKSLVASYLVDYLKNDSTDDAYRRVGRMLNEFGEDALQVLVPHALYHGDAWASKALNIMSEKTDVVSFAIQYLDAAIQNDPNNELQYLRSVRNLLLQCKTLNIQYPFRLGLQGFSDGLLRGLVNERIQAANALDQRPLAVVVFTRSDWNAAFANVKMIQDLINQGYRVMYYESSSRQQTIDAILDATKNQKATVIALGAHSTKEAMGFGIADPTVIRSPFMGGPYWGTSDINLMSEQELKDSGVSDRLIIGGHLILCACSSGEGREKEANVANMFRRIFPQAMHIWSTVLPAPVPEIEFDENNQIKNVKFTNDGKDSTYIGWVGDLNWVSPVAMSGFVGAMMIRSELRAKKSRIRKKSDGKRKEEGPVKESGLTRRSLLKATFGVTLLGAVGLAATRMWSRVRKQAFEENERDKWKTLYLSYGSHANLADAQQVLRALDEAYQNAPIDFESGKKKLAIMLEYILNFTDVRPALEKQHPKYQTLSDQEFLIQAKEDLRTIYARLLEKQRRERKLGLNRLAQIVKSIKDRAPGLYQFMQSIYEFAMKNQCAIIFEEPSFDVWYENQFAFLLTEQVDLQLFQNPKQALQLYKSMIVHFSKNNRGRDKDLVSTINAILEEDPKQAVFTHRGFNHYANHNLISSGNYKTKPPHLNFNSTDEYSRDGAFYFKNIQSANEISDEDAFQALMEGVLIDSINQSFPYSDAVKLAKVIIDRMSERGKGLTETDRTIKLRSVMESVFDSVAKRRIQTRQGLVIEFYNQGFILKDEMRHFRLRSELRGVKIEGKATKERVDDKTAKLTRRRLLVGAASVAGLVAVGGWFAWFRHKTRINWQTDEMQPTLESARAKLLQVLDWVKESGYPHPEILDEYAKGLANAKEMPADQRKQIFMKALIPGPSVSTRQVFINSNLVHQRLSAIRELDSDDFGIEAFASVLIQEAWGFALLRLIDLPENQNRMINAKQVLWDEFEKSIRKEKPFWPSNGFSRYYDLHANDVASFAAFVVASEFFEAEMREEFIDWAIKKKLLSLAASRKTVQKKITTKFQSTLNAMIEERERVARSLGDGEKMLAHDLQYFIVSSLPFLIQQPIDSSSRALDIKRAYAYYALVEFERFRRSGGREGLNPKIYNIIDAKKLPAWQEFLSSAKRLLPEVDGLVQEWKRELTRSELRNVNLERERENQDLARLKFIFVELLRAGIEAANVKKTDERVLNDIGTGLVNRLKDLNKKRFNKWISALDTALAASTAVPPDAKQQARLELLKQTRDKINRARELIEVGNGPAANTLLLNWAQKIGELYLQTLDEKFRRVQQRRKVFGGQIRYSHRTHEYVLSPGRFTKVPVGKDESISLVAFKETRYKTIWEALRAIDHQLDSEYTNVVHAKNVLYDIEKIRSGLEPYRSNGDEPLPDVVRQAAVQSLDLLAAKLNSQWVVEKELAQLAVLSAKSQLEAGNWRFASQILYLASQLIAQRLKDVEQIIERIEEGRLASLRRAISVRNNYLLSRISKMKSWLWKYALGLSSYLQNNLEPDLRGVRELVIIAHSSYNRAEAARASKQWSRMRHFNNEANVYLQLAEERVQASVKIQEFVQSYRGRFKRIRLSGTEESAAREQAFREEYAEFVAQNKQVVKPHLWGYRFYQAIFVPLNIDNPVKKDERIPNPEFIAFSALIRMIEISNIERILKQKNLLVQIKPTVEQKETLRQFLDSNKKARPDMSSFSNLKDEREKLIQLVAQDRGANPDKFLAHVKKAAELVTVKRSELRSDSELSVDDIESITRLRELAAKLIDFEMKQVSGNASLDYDSLGMKFLQMIRSEMPAQEQTILFKVLNRAYGKKKGFELGGLFEFLVNLAFTEGNRKVDIDPVDALLFSVAGQLRSFISRRDLLKLSTALVLDRLTGGSLGKTVASITVPASRILQVEKFSLYALRTFVWNEADWIVDRIGNELSDSIGPINQGHYFLLNTIFRAQFHPKVWGEDQLRMFGEQNESALAMMWQAAELEADRLWPEEKRRHEGYWDSIHANLDHAQSEAMLTGRDFTALLNEGYERIDHVTREREYGTQVPWRHLRAFQIEPASDQKTLVERIFEQKLMDESKQPGSFLSPLMSNIRSIEPIVKQSARILKALPPEKVEEAYRLVYSGGDDEALLDWAKRLHEGKEELGNEDETISEIRPAKEELGRLFEIRSRIERIERKLNAFEQPYLDQAERDFYNQHGPVEKIDARIKEANEKIEKLRIAWIETDDLPRIDSSRSELRNAAPGDTVITFMVTSYDGGFSYMVNIIPNVVRFVNRLAEYGIEVWLRRQDSKEVFNLSEFDFEKFQQVTTPNDISRMGFAVSIVVRDHREVLNGTLNGVVEDIEAIFQGLVDIPHETDFGSIRSNFESQKTVEGDPLEVRSELRRAPQTNFNQVAKRIFGEETINQTNRTGIILSRYLFSDYGNPELLAPIMKQLAQALDEPIAVIVTDSIMRNRVLSINAELPVEKRILMSVNYAGAKRQLERVRRATQFKVFAAESERGGEQEKTLRMVTDEPPTFLRQGDFQALFGALGVTQEMLQRYREELYLAYSA